MSFIDNIKSELRKNTLIFRLYFYLKTESKILKYRFGAAPILIYNLGKVGSTSIRKSLEKDNKYSVFSAHKLTKKGLSRQKNFEGKGKKKIDYEMALYSAERINKVFFNGVRLKVIALTRMPISRSISAIFESIIVDRPDIYNELENGVITVNELVECYQKQCVIPDKNNVWSDFSADWKAGPIAFDWVDHELIKKTGIDIYKDAFDKKAGYKIYSGNNIDLLIIRVENLRDVIKQSLHEFLGYKNFRLVDSNVGEEKFYASIYKEFKGQIKFDENYINAMHSTKYAQYFYTDEELKKESESFMNFSC